MASIAAAAASFGALRPVAAFDSLKTPRESSDARKNDAPEVPPMVITFCQSHVRVEGIPAQQEKFYRAWQTELWPDWETHPSNMGRAQYDHCVRVWEAGGAICYHYQGKEFKDAVWRALEEVNAIESVVIKSERSTVDLIHGSLRQSVATETIVATPGVVSLLRL